MELFFPSIFHILIVESHVSVKGNERAEVYSMLQQTNVMTCSLE